MTATTMPVMDNDDVERQIRLHQIGGVDIPVQKLAYGDANTETPVDESKPLPVKVMPYASGGLSKHHRKASADTNRVSVTTSATQLYMIHVFNAAASVKYLKLYNLAALPTLASDVPDPVYPLEAGKMTTINLGAGLPFSVGLAYAITGGLGDTDTTALTANDVILNMLYKN